MKQLLPAIAVLLCCLTLEAQSVQPTFDTIVYDSTGKPLGAAILPDPSGQGVAAIRMRLSDGQTIFLSIGSGSDWVRSFILFSLTGCTGQAWSSSLSTFPIQGAVGATVGKEGGLWLQTGGGRITDVLSVMESDGSCSDAPATLAAFPVENYLDLDNVYPPPFTIAGGKAPVSPSFADVPATHPFYQFVELIRAAGLTSGCGGGQYCVDNPITRGEMAVFLAIAMGLRFAP